MAHPPSLDLIVTHPSGVDVVRDYLAKDESVSVFFGRHFSDLSAFAIKAEEVDRRFDRAARQVFDGSHHVSDRPAELLAQLFGSSHCNTFRLMHLIL